MSKPIMDSHFKTQQRIDELDHASSLLHSIEDHVSDVLKDGNVNQSELAELLQGLDEIGIATDDVRERFEDEVIDGAVADDLWAMLESKLRPFGHKLLLDQQEAHDAAAKDLRGLRERLVGPRVV